MAERTIPVRDGEPRRGSRLRSFATGRARLVLLVACVAAVPSREARGLNAAAAKAPEERALGMERPASSLVFDSSASVPDGRRVRVSAGEWTLFEADGLAVGACAVEGWWANWGGIVAFGLLSSPVGDESAVSATFLGAGGERVRLACGGRLETVALDGCRREYLLSFSLDAIFRVSPRVAMCTRVGGVRAAGVPVPGADASLRVVAFPASPVCGVAGISVSRRGEVTGDVSARIRLAGRVRAVLGYEDASAAINGSLSIGVRDLVLEAGASVHPVLGVSKALFVSWRWGEWE